MSSPVGTSRLAVPDRAPPRCICSRMSSTRSSKKDEEKENSCVIKDDDVDEFYLFPLPSKKRIPESQLQERLARVLNRYTDSKAAKHSGCDEPPLPLTPAPTPLAITLTVEDEPYICSLRRRPVIRKKDNTKYPSLERHRRKFRENIDIQVIKPLESDSLTAELATGDVLPPKISRCKARHSPWSLTEEGSKESDIEFSNLAAPISKNGHLEVETRGSSATDSLETNVPSGSVTSYSSASEAEDAAASGRLTSAELLRKLQLLEVKPDYDAMALHADNLDIYTFLSADAEKCARLNTKMVKSKRDSFEERGVHRHDKLLVNTVLMAIAASSSTR